jgi:hypothetical protein
MGERKYGGKDCTDTCRCNDKKTEDLFVLAGKMI